MRFKSKYYKRNLSIYVFIYILSIITLLMMIVNSLNTFLQSEIETNIKMNLEKPLTSIDENLNLINRIVIDICDNEELFLKPKLENGYSKSLINKALKDYLFVNAFYEDLIFYYRGSNEVFSTDDYDTKTKFFSQSYNFIDKSEDEVEFWLNKSKEPMLVPATKILRYGHIEKKVILYVFPILNREPEATAIFVIDNEWFYNNLNSLNNKYDCSISLYSSNNLITELQFAEQQKNNRQLFFELNNHPRRISMKVSINKAGIYRPLYSVYIIISVYVIGLLLAGLFLITYFTRRAYIPIMNLKRMFEIEEKDNREKFVLENKDDFDVIRSGIKKIQGLNSDLQNSLYERDEKLRCMTIKNILNFEQADEEINNMIFVEKDTNGNKIYQRILLVLSKDEHVSNMCFDLLCNLNNLNVYQFFCV